MVGRKTAAPCREIVDGPSEHGGVCTVTYYFDTHYKPVEKAQATRAIVHEYDEKNRSVHRQYLTFADHDYNYDPPQTDGPKGSRKRPRRKPGFKPQ